MNPVIARFAFVCQLALFCAVVIGVVALFHHLPDSSQLAAQIDSHMENLP